MTEDIDPIRFIIYFAYGITYGIVVGLLNMNIEKLRTRSEWWNHWIVRLEVERKTVHVLSWFCFWILHDLVPMSFSTNSLAIYLGFASASLAALNLLRLNSQTVKDWVNENWKGFLREEDDDWPAVIALFAAIAISNYTTGLRYPFP
jgi:hypothetical protein